MSNIETIANEFTRLAPQFTTGEQTMSDMTKSMGYAWRLAGYGGNMDIHEIAAQFARLAPDYLDDFERYVGVEEEDSHWYSVWALNDDGIGHRIISIHRDDIPELAKRMRALPDGTLNDERLYRGMPLFEGLLVDVG